MSDPAPSRRLWSVIATRIRSGRRIVWNSGKVRQAGSEHHRPYLPFLLVTVSSPRLIYTVPSTMVLGSIFGASGVCKLRERRTQLPHHLPRPHFLEGTRVSSTVSPSVIGGKAITSISVATISCLRRRHTFTGGVCRRRCIPANVRRWDGCTVVIRITANNKSLCTCFHVPRR